MSKENFVKRDSSTSYFVTTGTGTSKVTEKPQPQQTATKIDSPYSSTQARVVVKKYALKRD